MAVQHGKPQTISENEANEILAEVVADFAINFPGALYMLTGNVDVHGYHKDRIENALRRLGYTQAADDLKRLPAVL